MSNYGGGYPPPPEGGYPPPPEGSYPPPPEGSYPPPSYPPSEGGYQPPEYGFPPTNVHQPFVSQPSYPDQSSVSFQDTSEKTRQQDFYASPYPDQSSQPLLTRYSLVESDQTHHYGRPPTRQPRRYKTVKRVKLFDGNFVIDCPVPERLLQQVPRRDDQEFTHMRYTACTCKPDEFKDAKYTLRQQQFDPPRQTELFIVLTMYNEDEVLFARTFHGVVKNIIHLCSRDRSRVWGKDGWKKVVVCVVSDGRAKINRRTLAYLAAIGVYQEGVAKNYVESIREDGKKEKKEVTAHIYEYTTQMSFDSELNIKTENIVPIQVLFCLKEKNAKKINSHRWFFNAFGAILNPNVCVLLDVGTKPGGTSIYHLWKAFDINSNVAGACGEIVAMKGTAGVNLLNPIVACQNFEYKMSNILDKPLESVFGYITVLPGAFSAYRYIALQNDKNGLGPLHSYFLGEAAHAPASESGDKKKEEKSDIFTANMYLAEDRILCFELVAKRSCSWVLHYVKSAYAETDVPDQVPELISQRRRWLNGSFFAGVYAVYNTFAIWRSDHTAIRKVLLHVEMLYQSYNLFFSWFALGNFYLTFYILGNSLTDPYVIEGLWSKTAGDILFQILRYVYLTLLIVQFIMAMGNRPQGSKWEYITSITFFAFVMVYMLFAAGWLTYKGVALELDRQRGALTGADVSTASAILGNSTFRNIILSVVSTYGLYFVASFLFFEPWHMFTSLGQYLLLVPFYINILNVYAFCNVHDVSWGTKGDTSAKQDLGSAKVSSGKSEVEVEVPVEEKDINEAYDEAVEELKQHVEEEVKHRSPSEKREDYNKAFRTRVVLAWMISNGALVAVITSANSTLSAMLPQEARSNTYMAFILWSVTGLAAFRFVGSCTFLLFRLFTGN